ncbi:inactivated Zn-dependent hydrolase of the beta-lactamase fold [Cyanobium sp. PCC 7001]|uniref:MBL fold metallo-hydrolase n=1 Tax=Cyanobium sp. PCC 7001 TaxID=180281 RepID=UPI00018052BC|nr:MBL fold metallo-hydrolase [Cyanobium sp. PCC 7001]EDY37261.1 inactivated Zn-dependent hydrolase of the beta-lactamase fold [Cyanobium sp. PCC 7001]
MPLGLQATYYGANGWLLQFDQLSVLVDPWLTGALEFPPGPWFFRGQLPRPWPVPEGLDLLLLTQGLADHCHPPSLELLDRDLPVVASPTAARRVRQLGFQHVTALAPGESHSLGDLGIRATAGAPVPQVENGYRLDHPAGSLYLEPHGFLDPSLPAEPLDAVITPVVDLGLPLAGPFVRGRQVLPSLLERFRPSTVLASTAGGDVRFEGLLTRALWQQGSAEEAALLSAGVGPHRLIDPVPGEPYQLAGAG